MKSKDLMTILIYLASLFTPNPIPNDLDQNNLNIPNIPVD